MEQGCSEIPRSRLWRARYRIGQRLWWAWRRPCLWISEKTKPLVGMGDTFSTFWYGINEGAWTVCCGHSLTDGIRYCVWIWRGCPRPFPSERRKP